MNNLKLSDIEKDVPVKEVQELLEKKTSDLKLQSDLYHHIAYTVVAKDCNIKLGIIPEDQKFSRRYVFVWDDYNNLIRFSSDDWKIIKVTIPKDEKRNALSPVGGVGIYAVRKIPNTWGIEEQKDKPLYVE